MAKGDNNKPAVASAKAAPAAKKGDNFHAEHAHLFVKKTVGKIGNGILPKIDLTRMVKWPRIVRIQRQRAILKQRLKVPPAIHFFTKTLEASQGM